MIEVHIFPKRIDWDAIGGYDCYETTWEGTINKINTTIQKQKQKPTNNPYKIATTQVAILYLKLLNYSYLRVFIHEDGNVTEIKLGDIFGSSKICRASNLFYFWLRGLFRKK